ncbi:MAG: hypothetical protein HW416_3457 [Chloroflexi bacterium]|nr:hypothetical protein [Chloroflexota bacterium]
MDLVHTGPGTLAGRYLRSYWQPIARSEEVAPGRAIPARVMSEDITAYRGEGGAPHVLAFRCAHRGTQLSTGWVEGDDLRCFYHGWKYDGSGQCIEQPAEPEPFCNRIKIKSYPTREYLGLIFAYLGEGEPPAFRRYMVFEGDGMLEVGPAITAPVNFFNRVDNAPDHAHLIFVHSPFMDSLGMPKFESEETDWGVTTVAFFNNNIVNRTHFVIPNTTLFPARPKMPGNPVWTDHIAWVVPSDDESYRFFQCSLTHGATERTGRYGVVPAEGDFTKAGWEVVNGTKRITDFIKRPDIFEVQDFVAQRGQGVIADRENEHPGRSDMGVQLLRKVWEREMRRLEAGRPLKEWSIPEGLIATLQPE